MNKKTLFGHVITLFTVFIWGITFISTKVLLKNLHPIEILFFRFLMAYIALLLIHPRFKKPGSWKEELLFLAAGLCGVTVYFLMENISLEYTLASNTSLLVSLAPVFTAILAHLFVKGERLNPGLVLGSLMAFGGVFLVIFNGNYVLKLNPLGDLLAVAAALIWAIYTILLNKLGSGYNNLYLTRKIFFYGLLTMLPALFIFKVDFKMEKLLLPGVLPNLLFLGLVASSLCYILWNMAVNSIGVVKASSYIYVVPLVTILTAVIVLGERITALAAAGSVLILSGVYISERGGKIIPALRQCLGAFKNSSPS
ncbi:MAG: DMT family transporter [Clostridiales bacterium]|jgi:drug/metabolite transporter (DMT)-like permease|nr:DMT family transporter [Eubacteriales bacterium]MDH7567581.1 DMT family transporter [Clostridiales bacterium]